MLCVCVCDSDIPFLFFYCILTSTPKAEWEVENYGESKGCRKLKGSKNVKTGVLEKEEENAVFFYCCSLSFCLFGEKKRTNIN